MLFVPTETRDLPLPTWNVNGPRVSASQHMLLKHNTSDIAAVVLLDGLHAAWEPTHASHTTGRRVRGCRARPGRCASSACNGRAGGEELLEPE